MALDFSQTKGKAQRSAHESYNYVDGEQVVRIFGGILPRYVYWIKGSNNKDIPVECLSFDRNLEKFTNKEVDHVPEYYPDKNRNWAYSVNCIDMKDGKVKILNLKKKLFESIIVAAEDLGAPTDPDTGWDIHFKRVRTGAQLYNVEYQLQILRCKKRALTDAEKELISTSLSIDEKLPRPTPEEVKSLLDKIHSKEEAEVSADPAEREAINELNT